MASCWNNMRAFYELAEDRIGNVFAAYGRFAARHAWKVLFGSLALNVMMGFGLLRFNINEDNANVYFPQGSRAYLDQAKVQALFPEPSRDNFQSLQLSTLGSWARIIVKSKTGNLMNQSTLDELSEMNDMIHNINATTEDGKNITWKILVAWVPVPVTLCDTQYNRDRNTGKKIQLSDICARVHGDCNVDGSLFWSDYFKSAVEYHYVKYPVVVLPTGQVMNYQTQIGGKIQHNKTHLQGVEYIRFMYWIRSDNKSYESTIDKWSAEFIKTMKSYTARHFDVAFCHDKSLDEELARNIVNDVTLFTITMMLMVGYAYFAVTSRISNQVGQRIFLAYGGIMASTLAILASFGFCSLIGVDFVALVGVVPFLIIGIGIDDMFIMLSGLSGAQGESSVEEKIAKTMRLSGVGITITSLTDFLAFMAGSFSVFISVSHFCIYTGIAVVFCYINNVTLFCACMAINERRVAQGRHFAICRKIPTQEQLEREGTHSSLKIFCCSGQPPTSREEAESYLDRLPRWFLPKLVLKTPIKVAICVAFLGYLGASIYGCINLKEGLRVNELVSEESYYHKFASWEQVEFKRQAPVSFVIDTTYDYSDSSVQAALDELITSAKASSYIDDTFSINWLSAYKSSTYYDNSSESSFITGLQTFLSQPQFSRYENDVFIDTVKKQIPVSRFYLISVALASDHEGGNFMLKVREIADGSTSINCFAFHPAFIVYEQFVAILGQTLRTVGVALVAVLLVTCFFMPHPVLIIFCTLAVLMIMLGIFGFLYYLDMALSSITMVHLIMSIGFSVDFTAHICHGYMTSGGVSRNNRVKQAIDKTGAPIFHGAISSILGIVILFPSKSYIFRTFAYVMCLVLVFGICHAILLLPVILSWFGPSRSKSLNDKVEVDGSDRPLGDMGKDRNGKSEEDGPLEMEELIGKTPDKGV